jgi:hypothetical protein
MATFIPLAARLRPGVTVGELFVAWGLASAASWVLAADSRLPAAVRFAGLPLVLG